MIDREEAERIASAEIAQLEPPYEGDEMALIPEATMERPFGWVFFYNTRRYLETQDPAVAMIGPAPMIVDQRDGSVHWLGTAAPVENYIHQYEQQRAPD